MRRSPGVPRRSALRHREVRTQRWRLFVHLAGRRSLALRLSPQRRHADLEVGLRQRESGSGRPQAIDRAGRGGEVRHTKETFGAYWDRWLAQRRPYLEAGTWTGYKTSGRKRLVPALGYLSLGELTVSMPRFRWHPCQRATPSRRQPATR